MNKFLDVVGKLPQIAEFVGGVDSDRKHRNELVKNLNAIRDAALLDPAGAAGNGGQIKGSLVITCIANGALATVRFQAELIA